MMPQFINENKQVVRKIMATEPFRVYSIIILPFYYLGPKEINVPMYLFSVIKSKMKTVIL